MRALQQWRTVLGTIAVTAVLAFLGGLAFVYSGVYDIAATEPHWGATHWVMQTVRTRSIKAHAVGIVPPPDLLNPAKIAMGTEHFSEHCSVCHGAPGVPKGDIAHGLYPPPPDLAVTAKLYSDSELFWVIKHGIKMTGMPAWSQHSDEEIWATVGFINKLKAGMTEQEYGELVKANMMGGMRHGPGGAMDGPPPAGGPAPSGQPAGDGHGRQQH